MTRKQQESIPTIYEIEIKGHLDERWADWFGSMSFIHESDGTTTLQGGAYRSGCLARLAQRDQDLGLPLISVQPVSPNREKASD